MDDTERKKLAAALREVEDASGHLGTELFDQIARFSTTIAFEAVLLRYNNEERDIDVYLTQRDPKDTAYPGEWHCPGSIFRRGEQPEDVALRLGEREFGAPILEFHYVKDHFHQEARGWFLAKIYLVTVELGPELRGRWFPSRQLPERTVRHHREVIIPAATDDAAAQRWWGYY